MVNGELQIVIKVQEMHKNYQKRDRAFQLQYFINNIKIEVKIFSGGGVRRTADEELLKELIKMYEK